MRAGLLFAIVACVGLAWSGIASGACRPELRQKLEKLVGYGLSEDDVSELCGQDKKSEPKDSATLKYWNGINNIIAEGGKEFQSEVNNFRQTSCNMKGPIERGLCMTRRGIRLNDHLAVIFQDISQQISRLSRPQGVDIEVANIAVNFQYLRQK